MFNLKLAMRQRNRVAERTVLMVYAYNLLPLPHSGIEVDGCTSPQVVHDGGKAVCDWSIGKLPLT